MSAKHAMLVVIVVTLAKIHAFYLRSVGMDVNHVILAKRLVLAVKSVLVAHAKLVMLPSR